MLLPARFPSASRSAHSFRLRTSQAAELKSHHHALWWQHFSAYLQAVMFTSFLKLLCFNYNFTIKMPLRFCSYKSAPCLTERQGALKSCILNPSISRGYVLAEPTKRDWHKNSVLQSTAKRLCGHKKNRLVQGRSELLGINCIIDCENAIFSNFKKMTVYLHTDKIPFEPYRCNTC